MLSAATGVTLYLVSDKKHQDFKNQCERFGCPENSSEQADIQRLDLLSSIGIFGGLALGAAGDGQARAAITVDQPLDETQLATLRATPGVLSLQQV